MYDRFAFIRKKINMFFFGCVLILAIAIVMMGNDRGWFRPKVVYSTLLKSTYGVHIGTAVKMAGLTIGSVSNISLEGYDRIRVDISIFSDYRDRIRKDSFFKVWSPTIIGPHIVELVIGSPNNLIVEPGSILKSSVPLDWQSLLTTTNWEGKKDSSQVLIDRAISVFNQFELIVHRMAEVMTTADYAFKTLGEASSKLDQVAVKIQSEDTSLGKILNNKESLFLSLTSTLDEVESLMSRLHGMQKRVDNETSKLFKGTASIIEDAGLLTQNFKTVSEDAPILMGSFQATLLQLKLILSALERHWLIRGYVNDIKEEEIQNKMNKN